MVESNVEFRIRTNSITADDMGFSNFLYLLTPMRFPKDGYVNCLWKPNREFHTASEVGYVARSSDSALVHPLRLATFANVPTASAHARGLAKLVPKSEPRCDKCAINGLFVLGLTVS